MKKNRNKHTSQATPLPEVREAMAVLASGMADDFNNILTTVMGACSLIDLDEPNNSELLQCVAMIRTSAERAAVLSDKLKRISESVHENGSCASKIPESGTETISTRDKNNNDDIVSSNNLGGTSS